MVTRNKDRAISIGCTAEIIYHATVNWSCYWGVMGNWKSGTDHSGCYSKRVCRCLGCDFTVGCIRTANDCRAEVNSGVFCVIISSDSVGSIVLQVHKQLLMRSSISKIFTWQALIFIDKNSTSNVNKTESINRSLESLCWCGRKKSQFWVCSECQGQPSWQKYLLLLKGASCQEKGFSVSFYLI